MAKDDRFVWFFELLSPVGVSLRHSFGKLKLPSSQATLLRVALFVERGALCGFSNSSPLRGAKSSSVYRGNLVQASEWMLAYTRNEHSQVSPEAMKLNNRGNRDPSVASLCQDDKFAFIVFFTPHRFAELLYKQRSALSKVVEFTRGALFRFF